MFRPCLTIALAVILLTPGLSLAKWPPTLELDWFELPDARSIECEPETPCAAVSIDFKQLKKHIRKLLYRKSREIRIEEAPWSKDGELRRKALIAGPAAVELLFDEASGTVAVITLPSCLDSTQLVEFASDQLDPEPQVIERARPDFPAEARQHRIGGLAIVHGIVRSDGRLTDLCSAVAVPTGHGFEEAALEALGRWRWKPGRHDGTAVDSRVAIVIQWDVR